VDNKEVGERLVGAVINHLGDGPIYNWLYEDFDIALKYISDFPSLGLIKEAKQVQSKCKEYFVKRSW
jgi:hypothetical protein